MIIHDRLGFIVTVLALVGAVAALVSLVRPQLLPTVRVYLILATGVVGLQALVGLILVLTGSRPAQLIHWFYGGATLVSLPLTTWIGRRRSPRAEQLWIVGGALATFLFSVRAIVTG